MNGWLVDWLAGWLVGRLASWLHLGGVSPRLNPRVIFFGRSVRGRFLCLQTREKGAMICTYFEVHTLATSSAKLTSWFVELRVGHIPSRERDFLVSAAFRDLTKNLAFETSERLSSPGHHALSPSHP